MLMMTMMTWMVLVAYPGTKVCAAAADVAAPYGEGEETTMRRRRRTTTRMGGT